LHDEFFELLSVLFGWCSMVFWWRTSSESDGSHAIYALGSSQFLAFQESITSGEPMSASFAVPFSVDFESFHGGTWSWKLVSFGWLSAAASMIVLQRRNTIGGLLEVSHNI